MNEIKLFEAQRVRVFWDEENQKCYLSVIDIIETLTDSSIPKRYWSDLKKKLLVEGSQLYEKIVQLKLPAADGKKYATDCLETADIFRLIQSIPSPKAEPFKLWLAKVASERLDELQDPELTIDRALAQYLNLGYSESWINQRLKSIEIRKELTKQRTNNGTNQQFSDLQQSQRGNTRRCFCRGRNRVAYPKKHGRAFCCVQINDQRTFE